MSYAALPALRTPRLTLRPLEPSDADAIAEGVGNYDVSRWLGAVPYPYGADDARKYIEAVHEEVQNVWGIEDDTGLVGTISTHERLGYWLARTVWRKGYGFEACVAVIDHWFSSPDHPDLTAGYFDGNDRSAVLLRALGFQFAGPEVTFSKSLNQEVPATTVVLTRKRWQAFRDFTVYTPRLTLRPLEARDAAAFAALTVPEVTRMLTRLKTNMTEAEVLVDLPRRTWRGYPGFTIAIEHQGCMIGTIGMGGWPFSIGYFLAPDHWGQGLMTEALSAYIPEVFDRFPMRRLTADHFEDNPASGVILKKFGFTETGRKMGTSDARLEPAPLITYALERDKLRIPV